MDYLSKSYGLYMDFCNENGYESLVINEYEDLLDEAIKRLDRQPKPEDGKANLIVYKIKEMYIKFKLIGDNVEINFFTEDQYNNVISKYKETE